MKAALYYSQTDIRVTDVPIPEIGKDEVLVNMKACGVCGSDLMDWYLKNRVPLVLGHEPAGVVTEIGEEVSQVKVGDRVFVHHHVACMTCHYCSRGDYTLCKQFHDTNIVPGGFAEFFKVPSANLQLDTLQISGKLSFEEATLVEPVGCCIRALKKCDLQAGDSVAVIGAGPTGLIHVALSEIYGASIIMASDLVDFRLNCAKRMGADRAINPSRQDLGRAVKDETDGRGVDIAVVTAPSIEAYKAGISVCRKGGTLCVFAPTNPEGKLELSPKDLFFSEIKIVPSYSSSHLETSEALRLMESGKLNLKELITHRFRLEKTAEAFKTALEGRESLKVVILND